MMQKNNADVRVVRTGTLSIVKFSRRVPQIREFQRRRVEEFSTLVEEAIAEKFDDDGL